MIPLLSVLLTAISVQRKDSSISIQDSHIKRKCQKLQRNPTREFLAAYKQRDLKSSQVFSNILILLRFRIFGAPNNVKVKNAPNKFLIFPPTSSVYELILSELKREPMQFHVLLFHYCQWIITSKSDFYQIKNGVKRHMKSSMSKLSSGDNFPVRHVKSAVLRFIFIMTWIWSNFAFATTLP